ncbi:hypothetical protein BJX63DRAFT_354349 [Aspergillus granulosus]|uniref:Uncharacterized protein n=1 Tax=Aspergillus granulosus TaxID=176169 RepID=A0ABR4H2U7_9EURO
MAISGNVARTSRYATLLHICIIGMAGLVTYWHGAVQRYSSRRQETPSSDNGQAGRYPFPARNTPLSSLSGGLQIALPPAISDASGRPPPSSPPPDFGGPEPHLAREGCIGIGPLRFLPHIGSSHGSTRRRDCLHWRSSSAELTDLEKSLRSGYSTSCCRFHPRIRCPSLVLAHSVSGEIQPSTTPVEAPANRWPGNSTPGNGRPWVRTIRNSNTSKLRGIEHCLLTRHHPSANHVQVPHAHRCVPLLLGANSLTPDSVCRATAVQHPNMTDRLLGSC